MSGEEQAAPSRSSTTVEVVPTTLTEGSSPARPGQDVDLGVMDGRAAAAWPGTAARWMLLAAFGVEVEQYIEAHADARGADDR